MSAILHLQFPLLPTKHIQSANADTAGAFEKQTEIESHNQETWFKISLLFIMFTLI